jgi:hypothetical protein
MYSTTPLLVWCHTQAAKALDLRMPYDVAALAAIFGLNPQVDTLLPSSITLRP